MREKSEEFGLDEESAARWMGVVRDTVGRYFRTELIGGENLPRGRGLIVGCHSGVIPYDAALTLAAIHEETGRFAWGLADRLFGRLGPVADFLRRQGAVVGGPRISEALLRRGRLVLIFPGGALDMERPYLTQRYRIVPHRGWAPGHGGYVKLALRTRAPIVPLAIVGGEEIHIVVGNLAPLARLLNVPAIPLVLSPLPLPVKLYIRFGEPFTLPGGPEDARDQRRVDHLNRLVRRRVQALIDDTRSHRRGVIFSEYVNGRRKVARVPAREVRRSA